MASFSALIDQFKNRRLAIISDDSDSGRAVLVSPAQNISEETVNELLSSGGNLLFVALSPERVKAFALSKMSASRPVATTSASEIAQICVSVEARHGTTTGISVSDRTTTIRVLAESEPSPRKIITPGHIFPLEVREGGTLVRASLPEAAFDLAKVSCSQDSVAYADLLNDQGEYLSLPEQQSLSTKLKIPFISLTELIRYRLETEQLVTRIAETKLPTSIGGDFKAYIYHSTIHSGEHLVLVKGAIDPDKAILTRVQPEFTFADVFGGSNPPTRKTLHLALKAVEAHGAGVVVYLRRPSEGQLSQQVNAWKEKFSEKPAVSMREYGLGAQILRDMGVRKINLLTNSKRNLVGINSFGIEIISTTPLNDSSCHKN